MQTEQLLSEKQHQNSRVQRSFVVAVVAFLLVGAIVGALVVNRVSEPANVGADTVKQLIARPITNAHDDMTQGGNFEMEATDMRSQSVQRPMTEVANARLLKLGSRLGYRVEKVDLSKMTDKLVASDGTWYGPFGIKSCFYGNKYIRGRAGGNNALIDSAPHLLGWEKFKFEFYSYYHIYNIQWKNFLTVQGTTVTTNVARDTFGRFIVLKRVRKNPAGNLVYAGVMILDWATDKFLAIKSNGDVVAVNDDSNAACLVLVKTTL